MEKYLTDTDRRNNKLVGIWLLIGVGMVIIQFLLGGVTRLTGSGLSITEWNIVTGTLPPLNEKQWFVEFFKYQETPQYRLLNTDFTLEDFKSIFFWEWFHRLWARLLGVVFAIGFIYFLVTKKFQKTMIAPLVVLFILGALQGAVGWIMVASGLDGDAVYVRPTRLALHFIFALLLLAYTFWFALKLLVSKKSLTGKRSLKRLDLVIIFVLFFQLIYGALMAGHKAATVAPTWPSINGHTVPPGIYKPGLLNFIDNKLFIHFAHRGMAYLLLVLVVIWTILAFRTRASTLFRQTRMIPILLIFMQAVLGVATVLASTGIRPNRWGNFEGLAELHQLTGMLFLLVMVFMLYLNHRISKNRRYKSSRSSSSKTEVSSE